MRKDIDADDLKDWVENWLYKDRYYHNGRVSKTIPITELYDILEQMPTADVVEVVRCKECKYHEDEEPGAVYCPDRVGGWVSEDFFCAGGERREDEQETLWGL